MGRKKNPEKKTTEEIVRQALDKEQQNYIASRQLGFEASVEKGEESREAFKYFWATARKEYGKAKDLEDILWAHLKATGNDKPELFEKGLKHFGLKK